VTRTPPEAVGRFRTELRRLLPDGTEKPLAVAVSGGPDSLALLWLAAQALPGGAVAATVDHGLREGAAAEAAAVGTACRALGVPHAVLTVEVTSHGVGMQAAARTARYRALAVWARAAGAAALATAHHRDDQAETVLMRLMRGSGVGGLAGIRQLRPLAPGLALVRPLLGWSRAELAGVTAAAGLRPADDPANRDPRHDRTRVRALLAREPALAPARLAAAADALGEAEEALAWMAARLSAERVRQEGDALVLDVAGLPRELRRRLLAGLLPDARGDAVARLVHRLEAGQAGSLGGWLVRPGAAGWRLVAAPPRRARPVSPFHCY